MFSNIVAAVIFVTLHLLFNCCNASSCSTGYGYANCSLTVTNFAFSDWTVDNLATMQNILSGAFLVTNGQVNASVPNYARRLVEDGNSIVIVPSVSRITTSYTTSTTVIFDICVQLSEVPSVYTSYGQYISDILWRNAYYGAFTLAFKSFVDYSGDIDLIDIPADLILSNGMQVEQSSTRRPVDDTQRYGGRSAVIAFMCIVCGLTFLRMLRKHHIMLHAKKKWSMPMCVPTSL